MKLKFSLNFFWLIVWAVVFVGAVLSYFWRPAVFGVAVIAAVMFGTFLADYIHDCKLK